MLNSFRTIATKYYGPTNVKGSKIIARASDRSHNPKGQTLVWGYKNEMGPDENHAAAAQALAEKLGWGGDWVMGSADKGHVFIRLGDKIPSHRFTSKGKPNA